MPVSSHCSIFAMEINNLPCTVLVLEISHIDICINPKKLLDSNDGQSANDGHYMLNLYGTFN